MGKIELQSIYEDICQLLDAHLKLKCNVTKENL